MSKKPSGNTSLRLFVGVTLPQSIVAPLAAWQAQAERAISQLRRARPGGLHFTLAFLGQTSEQDAQQVQALLGALELRAITLTLDRRPVAVPPRGAPRLIAAQLSKGAEALARLQADIARELEAGRFLEPKSRPYWPHLTLARIRKPQRGERPLRRLEGLPALAEDATKAFDPVAVTLFKSELRPHGATYTALTECPFPQT